MLRISVLATKDDEVETASRRKMAVIQWCDRSSAKLNIGTRGHEVLNLRADRERTRVSVPGKTRTR